MKLEALLSEKEKEYFYIMHLSYNGRERERLWNHAKEKNLIGLDYPDVVTDDWIKVREAAKGSLPKIWVRQFDIFCKEMRVGDIVLVLNGWDSLLGIAEITGRRHRYDKKLSDKGTFFDHVREVQWIRKYEYTDRLTLPQPIKGFNNTLFKVKPYTRRWLILMNLNV
jgi:hypothetical protein